MTALTAPRNTVRRTGSDRSVGVAANAVIFSGALVCRNANGFLVPGSASTTLVALGRAEESVTGTATNGEAVCRVAAGVFRWSNSASGDLITIADIGNDCFIVDDDQVAKTSASNTRSVAGRIIDVDAQGVWVSTGLVTAG
jgi:hypothetical protein